MRGTDESTGGRRSRPAAGGALTQAGAGLWSGAVQGWRAFRLAPSTAWGLTVAFALGLAVTGLAFAAYEAVVLRPLPFDSQDLFLVRVFRPESDARWQWPSGRQFAAVRDRLASGQVAAVSRGGARVGVHAGGRSLSVLKADASRDLFDALGIRVRCDAAAPSGPTVLMSRRLAADIFGRSGGCGELVSIEGVPHRVAGILPADFRWQYGVNQFDLWTDVPDSTIEQARQLDVVVRLHAGATAERLESELGSLHLDTPDATAPRPTLRAVLLESVLLDDNPRVVAALMSIIVLAGVMGVANIAALFLSRARDRLTQTRIRVALGASGFRLGSEIVSEVVVYSGIGALLAAAAIAVVTPLISGHITAALPAARGLEVNWRVLLFLTSAAITAALVVSLPSLLVVASAGDSPSGNLLVTGRASYSRAAVLVRQGLLCFQFAVVVVVLTAAALSALSASRLIRTELGFDPSGVVTFQLRPKGAAYRTVEGVSGYYRNVLARVRAVRGVQAASLASGFPLGGVDSRVYVGHTAQEVSQPGGPTAAVRAVEEQYVSVLGLTMLAGEPLTAGHDRSTGVLPVVINQTLSARLWPGTSPIGQSFSIGEPLGAGRTRARVAQVIGVYRDTVTRGLAAPTPEICVPPGASPLLSTNLLVRLSGAGRGTLQEISEQIVAADPSQFIVYGDPGSLADAVDEVLHRPRLYAKTTLLLSLGVGGLALYGLYALVTHSLASRRRDLAIMASLGASMRHILVVAAWPTAVAAAIGVGLGVLVSAALFPSLTTTLGLNSENSVALQLAVVLSLAAACIPTVAVPVARSWRVSPASVLRS